MRLGHDPHYKSIQTLTITFKTHYKAACELTIDDSVIGTKCRVTFLHYLYKKTTNGEQKDRCVLMQPLLMAQHSQAMYIRMYDDICWQCFPTISYEAIRGLSEKVLESYFVIKQASMGYWAAR